MSEKLWGGRFEGKTDEGVESFTSSINVDKRLYTYDIDGSIAHSRMLAKCGIITEEDASVLAEGLEKIRTEIANGQFVFTDRLEDIHMHVENRLAELVGPVSQKLHTARSRNDQVALDVRLYLKDIAKQVVSGLAELRKTIVGLAAKYIDVIMPGYTHLQRAQPVLFSHHLMAYYEMFERDAARFAEGLKRIDVMPLGAAALAGTPHPIDRHYTAGLLGFAMVSENSIDSVSDRDFMIEFLSSASVCMMHLSRFSEELVLWSSSEFRFIELSDAFSTGSSIMPQKKNPDVPELIRGKTARIFGSLVSLLVLMKALPLAYNRDMQEDKAPLFDAADTLNSCIQIFIRMLSQVTVNSKNMGDAVLTGFINATDMADYLVARGMPFREAHGCSGKAVGFALKKNKELHDLTLDEMQSISGLIQEDIFQYLTPRAMVDRRRSWGGTATDNVRAAIQRAVEALRKENFK
jgi:argininosuccinate lyase